MYGHIQKLAEAEKKGIELAGGSADIFQYSSQLAKILCPGEENETANEPSCLSIHDRSAD
jgi:hypothetical protein